MVKKTAVEERNACTQTAPDTIVSNELMGSMVYNMFFLHQQELKRKNGFKGMKEKDLKEKDLKEKGLTEWGARITAPELRLLRA